MQDPCSYEKHATKVVFLNNKSRIDYSVDGLGQTESLFGSQVKFDLYPCTLQEEETPHALTIEHNKN